MKKYTRLFGTLCFMSILLIFASGSFSIKAQNSSTQEKNYQILQHIKIPDGYKEVDRIELSPDGTQVAFRVFFDPKIKMQNRGRQILVLNDKQISPNTDEIWRFYFSPDGKNIAYVMATPLNLLQQLATGGETYKMMTMVNDKLLTAANGCVFSPDSKKVAYQVYTNKQLTSCYLVIDGQKVSEEYDSINWMLFSPDSNQIAYRARKKDSYFIMMNNQSVGGIFKDAQRPFFAPISNKLAYAAQADKKWAVFFDNKKISPDLDKVESVFLENIPLVISPDGNKIAYKAKIDSKWYMMVNDKTITELESSGDTWAGLPVFSPDSGRIIYKAAKSRGKWHIMSDDRQISPDFDYINGNPVFNSDGTKIAFAASKDGKGYVMANDKKISNDFTDFKKMYTWHYNINHLAFNSDGTKIIFKVDYRRSITDYEYQNRKSIIVINDRQISPDFVVSNFQITAKGIYFAGYDDANNEVIHAFLGEF